MQVKPCMRLSFLSLFGAFIRKAAYDPLRGERPVIRFVRFRVRKFVRFEDALESPAEQRNLTFRLACDHATP